MATSVHPRLDNLLASLSLNLAEESQTALERAAGLAGSATVALLALEEILGDAHVGRIAAVLGLTHSGAVRLVSQLEREGLAERRSGADRRRVEVRLTPAGRRRAGRPGRPATRWSSRRPAASPPRRRRARGAAGQAGRGAGRQPHRTPPGRRGRRLLVPHLRLRGLRPTRGPLPGPGDGRAAFSPNRLAPVGIQITPSILNADFARLGDEVARIGSADWVHVDVMDNHFVPEPDLRPDHGRGAQQAHRRTPRRAPDDRRPRRQRDRRTSRRAAAR